MRLRLLQFFIFGSACLLTTVSAAAATFALKDGTTVHGRLVHYYDGSYTILTADGQRLKLTSEHLKTIDFAAAKSADSKSSTPSKNPFRSPKTTFSHWRDALQRGDLVAMSSCFVSTAEPLMLQKLKDLSTKDRDRMVADAKRTKFYPQRPKVDGDRATMEVKRRYKKKKATSMHTFVRENGNWKLVPN